MLNILFEKINTGKMITCQMFKELDIDELLDLRDEPEFDSEWMRVYNQLNALSYSKADKQVIDKIRKESYLMAYRVSNSSDIASCVSDDFDLITKAYVASIDDSWLNSVILKYADNKFPCGEIAIIQSDLNEAFKKLVI